LIYANHQLLVSFDRNNQVYLINVEIDHISFGLDAPSLNEENPADEEENPSNEEENSSIPNQSSDGYLGVITPEDEVGCRRNSKESYIFLLLFFPLFRRNQETTR
jgi:hypothetical protein